MLGRCPCTRYTRSSRWRGACEDCTASLLLEADHDADDADDDEVDSPCDDCVSCGCSLLYESGRRAAMASVSLLMASEMRMLKCGSAPGRVRNSRNSNSAFRS